MRANKTDAKGILYRSDVEEIDKIIIVDGSTGYSKTVSDEKTIQQFLLLISDIQFTPQENQEKRSGWRYSITLYDKDEFFSFTLQEIDNYYYDTTPDIHPIVEKFYKNLTVEEK